MNGAYTGRFAPSPTGPLHAGSLVAALASWLDARAHGGRWLVRIEDTDRPRTVPGAAQRILAQLAEHGLQPDAPPERQSDRTAGYAAALGQLHALDAAYACACSRGALRARTAPMARPGPAPAHPALPRPSACAAWGGPHSAVRLRTRSADGGHTVVQWHDRRLGDARQDVTLDVGDFVLRRADGCWSYQLAVVVDDAAQGITDVVRGGDLADNTPRQIHLQRLLGLPALRYLHTPLVRAADGQKLSKQTGAAPLPCGQPLAALGAAAAVLGLRVDAGGHTTTASWLASAVAAWAARWGAAPKGPARRCRRRHWHSMAPRPSTGPAASAMQTTPTGLQFNDVRPGDGPVAVAGDQVSVHYTGWLYADGSKGAKFDSSTDRGDPFDFPLGNGKVIKGWDEGVQGMRVGGLRSLLIPPQLGYGARGAGGVIPPNATLWFDVELLAIDG